MRMKKKFISYSSNLNQSIISREVKGSRYHRDFRSHIYTC